MSRTLSREEARAFYDRFAARQDNQGWYEDAALDALVHLGDFGAAQSVFEIGCGTGRLAARLLGEHLPPAARYVGLDISGTMAELARARLAPWSGRARVLLGDGGTEYGGLGGPFERVVATYVFDLMSGRDIDAALAGAHAVLAPGGLLCTAGLTEGVSTLSRATGALWKLVHRLRPARVGGCRPLMLADRLSDGDWRIEHREVVVSGGLASEVIVAEAI